VRQIKLTIAATETHCANEDDTVVCAHADQEWCQVFNRQIWKDGEYRRLPQCIAAEKEAGEEYRVESIPPSRWSE